MEYIFLDFNGTIIDDVKLSLDCLNLIRDEYLGLKALSLEEYRNIFTFPIKDYYLKAGFDFNKHSFEKVGQCWFDLYMQRCHEIPLMDGIERFLKYHYQKYKLVIISASKHDLLLQQVKHYGIAGYFEDILGIEDIYGASKLAIGQKYIQEHQGIKGTLIGDTLHDLEVARALNLDAKLVSRGHQSIDVLLSQTEEVYNDINAIII